MENKGATIIKTWSNSVLFVLFFVLQQIIAFTYLPFNLVTPYWIVVVSLFILIGLSLRCSKQNKEEFRFVLICASFSILTIVNGTTIGEVICKILYIIIGYWGLVFLKERRIKLVIFDFLLLALYVVFYKVYFHYDVNTRIMMDEDIFGHASSNTIAMTLNVVTYFYLLLSYYYKANNKKRLIAYSGFNFFLIIVQGSRAGMLVAFLILLVSIFVSHNTRSRFKYLLLFFGFIAIATYIIIRNLEIIDDFLTLNSISASSYNEDVRSSSLSAFFSKMDFFHFLFGYNDNYEFVSGISRTFNAFIDFWKVFGFAPFIYMAFLFIKRIIHHKDYDIPLVLLLPFFMYSLFESLWGGSFWDVLLLMVLFYSRNDKKVVKIHFELASTDAPVLS